MSKKAKTELKQTFLKMFVIVDKNYSIDYTTISYEKKGSIRFLLNGCSMTWKECYKLGYRCVRTNVIFETLI